MRLLKAPRVPATAENVLAQAFGEALCCIRNMHYSFTGPYRMTMCTCIATFMRVFYFEISTETLNEFEEQGTSATRTTLYQCGPYDLTNRDERRHCLKLLAGMRVFLLRSYVPQLRKLETKLLPV
eukprot:TRINITY_DN4482_c0_g1_i1.p1 TRINITY_DN4482_c0_g1~~TRINITY_DN4482_c0_g1_i1.p1  ORF type:complete len:125 (-),score=13.54 TRINITY_DN4482_c0_g1_i1:204-578(-)